MPPDVAHPAPGARAPPRALRCGIGFFEPPPPPEPELASARPAWAGPPENVLGAAIPLWLLLARTADVGVAVVGATAYPAGFSLTLAVRRRTLRDMYDIHDPLGRHPLRREPGGGIPDDILRFGVEFADGRKATTLDADGFLSTAEEPAGPVLLPQSGGGGGRSWDLEFWVWPLPPPGPLRFACEWPREGVEPTLAEVDAAAVLEAAARAEELWPDDEPPPRGFGGVRLS